MTSLEINGYYLSEQLYDGSRTLVYRGKRAVDQKPVVIKLLKNPHPSFTKLVQFRNQYTIAKNLNLSGVVRPYCLEPYQNGYALVMEFGGVSLQDYRSANSLSLQEFLIIAIQITDILAGLYEERVIHKDIKPANILIHPETKQVKLIDFSIASLLPKETQEIQSPNVLEGTLAYLSPEQTGRMNRGIDYRADYYSLGVTFYELLTGKLPFEVNDPMELVHCHIAKCPQFVDKINPQVPQAISSIVDKLMAKNADDRYQSALGLKHDLEICLYQLKDTGRIKNFIIGQGDICDRFVIPEKLYGREKEVKILLDAFERVSNPPIDGRGKELMLVAGFSGIGKTAVVNEVHKPIVRQRGYFIKGKFDQFQRNIPLSAFVLAFRDLMGQLSCESNVQLQRWKTLILNALGESARVIIDVIPELERIIGEQPHVVELSGSAGQNRFNLLFQKFIQVFASVDHPLVIFIDDLQWADSASLKLMQLLLSESDVSHLLLIGAYRDNEVFPAHPLMLTLSELEKNNVVINTITLAPLQQNHLNQLIADTLNCLIEAALPLTQLVYQKTKGNPFFSNQFLKALHDDKLITFVPLSSPIFRDKQSEIGGWQCDIAQVKAIALTDNVVEFMALQLQKLPSTTQNVLKLAACIGNQFDLATLAIVSEQTETDTATNLWKALQEGLIIPQNDIYKFYQFENASSQFQIADIHEKLAVNYKFLHDRVQQAAYSLIVEDEKKSIHLKIGYLLLAAIFDNQKSERIFDIVNQINIGQELINNQNQKNELAQLNLIAGRKAKASTAYTAAIDYCSLGIKQIIASGWESQYDVMLSLHEEAAEAAYLTGNFELMEQLTTQVQCNAVSILDKIKVYEIIIQSHLARNQLDKAIEIGLDVLNLLGIKLPAQPNKLQILLGLVKIKFVLLGKQPSSLLNLPEMKDATKLAAMGILASSLSAAFIGRPQLLPLIAFSMVNLSVKYGNTSLSAFAYAVYGLIICGVLQDIKTGYEFGQLALQVLKRFNAVFLKTKIYFIVNAFINHWHSHTQTTINPLIEAYQSGVENGDVEYASWSADSIGYHQLFIGQELSDLSEQMRGYSAVVNGFKQTNALIYLQTYHQAVLNLLNSKETYHLQGEVYDEDINLPQQIQANDKTGVFYSCVSQLFLCYIFGEYSSAVIKANLGKKYLEAGAGLLPVVPFNFYASLAFLAIYPEANKSKQKQIRQQIASNQKMMKKWALYAPMNHLHKFYLVEAEKYRVLGKKAQASAQAIDLYDKAIAGAKENKYVNEEALANELAAKFYLECGKDKIAQVYMTEAYYCYARWGASAKVKHLEKNYPHLLAPILQKQVQSNNQEDPIFNTLVSFNKTIATNIYSTSVSNLLDLSTVMKAAQALYSEINLDKLLSIIIQVVVENAGADKAVLFLNHQGSLKVAVKYFDNAIQSLEQKHVDKCNHVPVAVIHYVENTLETVISDSKTHLSIISDPYFTTHHPQSLLCTPILNQGKLVGILYLENSITSLAFTGERVELLKLLCSQAAISLENARLYQESQQQEAQYRGIFEAVSDGLVIADINTGKSIEVNPAYCEMLGYSYAEMLQIDTINLIHPDSHVLFADFLTTTQAGKKFQCEAVCLRKDGTSFNVEVRAVQINYKGQPCSLSVVRDVTQRKQMETAIQQAQMQVVQSEKMSSLGNLVAGVAHEINNPLGFIKGSLSNTGEYIQDLLGYIECIHQNHPQLAPSVTELAREIDIEYLCEDLPELISSMDSATDRIEEISTSLRTFSRADTSEKIACDIHEGLDSTLLILKYRLKANEFRPEIKIIKLYDKRPRIKCFLGQLNQVFMNILANAIDAIDEESQKYSFDELLANPKQISIKTELQDQNFTVCIKDNGLGMSDIVQSQIFDNLFTTKGVGKGTGLGLAIARQIVEETHGGKLSCNSILGEGTEFIIKLPLTDC